MSKKIRSFYHLLWAFFGKVFYRFPSHRLFVIGVTGTKGKSTVIELLNSIFEEAGKRTALFSSVRRKIGNADAVNLSGNTMPGRFAIQRFLREAVNAECEYAIVEVTSQGVLQHRHKFIHWDAAVFINLAPEHIEAHGSFENYRDAKVEFFRSLKDSAKKNKYFFLNEEDAQQKYFEEAAREVSNSRIIYFSRERFIKEDLQKHYDLHSRDKNVFGDWFLADFNLENAAAAVAIARSQGISWNEIKKGLEQFKCVPGRLEFIQKTPFAVIVDYAHTPDSLEKVYTTLEKNLLSISAGKLICVFGSAAGGRDIWKRPIMGKIAAEHCDTIFLTNEDPYDEDPKTIIKQIEGGFLNAVIPRLKPDLYFFIENRKEAIQKAILCAGKGDVVIITGKGSEPFMHIKGGEKIFWSDRKAVEETLEKK